MTMEAHAAGVLREARQRAGLTQRTLARRAGTAQSVVARIEAGLTDPGWNTLARLLRAAGHELEVELRPRATGRSHMLREVSRILALSPEDRLREVAAVDRFVRMARRA